MILLLPAWIALSLVMVAAWAHQRRAGNGGWADVYWSFGLGACGVALALAGGDGPRSWLVAAAIGGREEVAVDRIRMFGHDDSASHRRRSAGDSPGLSVAHRHPPRKAIQPL